MERNLNQNNHAVHAQANTRIFRLCHVNVCRLFLNGYDSSILRQAIELIEQSGSEEST
jgi:hypothetical protein